VPRRGRGGESVFDVGRLQAPSTTVTLVIAFRSVVTPRDVLKVREQLRAVIDDLRLRGDSASGGVAYVPALATDVASTSVVDACVREDVALLDRRGTMIVHQGPVYVHVVGYAAQDRSSHIHLHLFFPLATSERRFHLGAGQALATSGRRRRWLVPFHAPSM